MFTFDKQEFDEHKTMCEHYHHDAIIELLFELTSRLNELDTKIGNIETNLDYKL